MIEPNKTPTYPAAKKIAFEIITHFSLSKDNKGEYLTLSGDEIKALAALFIELLVKYRNAFKFVDNRLDDEEFINQVKQAISDYGEHSN